MSSMNDVPVTDLPHVMREIKKYQMAVESIRMTHRRECLRQNRYNQVKKQRYEATKRETDTD